MIRDNVYGDSMWDGRYGGVDPEPTNFAEIPDGFEPVPSDRNGDDAEKRKESEKQ